MASFHTPRGNAEILYEDGDVIVFSKPAGVLSERAEGSSERSVLDFLSEYTVGDVFPVHRLDRSTAGVMLAAKSREAAAALSSLMTSGGIHKEYIAVVLGNTPPSGRLEDELFFDRRAKKAYVVKAGKRGAKHAALEYERISSGETEGYPISVLKVRLFTGRTHQIRVQLANAGYPLAGDGRYGGGKVKYPSALRSYRISFDENAVRNSYFDRRPFGKYLSEHGYSLAESSGSAEELCSS